MIEWKRGGWTGSINRWVRREVREQLRDKALVQNCCPGLGQRDGEAYRAIPGRDGTSYR